MFYLKGKKIDGDEIDIDFDEVLVDLVGAVIMIVLVRVLGIW